MLRVRRRPPRPRSASAASSASSSLRSSPPAALEEGPAEAGWGPRSPRSTTSAQAPPAPLRSTPARPAGCSCCRRRGRRGRAPFTTMSGWAPAFGPAALAARARGSASAASQKAGAQCFLQLAPSTITTTTTARWRRSAGALDSTAANTSIPLAAPLVRRSPALRRTTCGRGASASRPAMGACRWRCRPRAGTLPYHLLILRVRGDRQPPRRPRLAQSGF